MALCCDDEWNDWHKHNKNEQWRKHAGHYLAVIAPYGDTTDWIWVVRTDTVTYKGTVSALDRNAELKTKNYAEKASIAIYNLDSQISEFGGSQQYT
jgi:hypothetical protein